MKKSIYVAALGAAVLTNHASADPLVGCDFSDAAVFNDPGGAYDNLPTSTDDIDPGDAVTVSDWVFANGGGFTGFDNNAQVGMPSDNVTKINGSDPDSAAPPAIGSDPTGLWSVSFSIDIPAGTTVNLSSVTFDWRKATGGGDVRWLAFDTSLDSGLLYSQNGQARNNVDSGNVDLSGPLYQGLTNQTVTFNWYAGGQGSGDVDFDTVIVNGTVSAPADDDMDGLADSWEDTHFGDGVPPATPAELALQSGTDDGYPTADGDGLDNLGEQAAETDPNVADTDNDGINDGDELSGAQNTAYGNAPTDPLDDDSDDDFLLDGEETSGSENTWVGNDPNAGPDGDATNPNATDSDGDGISDTDEIDAANGYGTNPALADSDGDGVDDDVEVANEAQGWDPTADDSGEDYDGDSLTTAEELALTNPSDPTNDDTDGDSLLDGAEVNTHGSDPTLVDTDGDLIIDPDEVANMTDPADPNDFPIVAWLQVTFALDPNGPVEPFYQPYLATDQTNGSVDHTESFAALGTTVDLTVSFPDLSGANPQVVKRMLNRNDANTANYNGTKATLIRNWVGLDVRNDTEANGPTVPTTLRLELDNVPAGTYLLRTYHHDVNNQHSRFGIITTDAGGTATLSDSFRGTLSTGSVQNDYDDPGAGNGPELLRSTVEQVIVSDGSTVTVDFQTVHDSPDDESILVINGLELNTTTDSDGDRVQDSDDQNPGMDDRLLDDDGDGLNNLEELLLNLDPTNPDTDGDGRKDGDENGDWTSTPGSIDETFIAVPSAGMVTLAWNPASTTDVEATDDLSLGVWPELITGVTSGDTIPVPASLASSPAVFFRPIPLPGGYGTSPWLADTDADGLNDGDELTAGTDPFVGDTDGDQFGDGWEVAAGSDPTDPADEPDNDGDGYNNAREIAAGSDPDDPASVPQPTDPDSFLFVDFNSNQNGGGDSSTDTDPSASTANWNQPGYQSYHANHEVIAEFATANYTAFGGAVTLLPTWPDTTDRRVQQSIGRGNDTWDGDQRSLLRDWIGIDTRTGNGGNGNYDGVTGTATRMDLTIGGLPAGTYNWTSYHHDLENVWADWALEISTDGGTTFGPITGKLQMTDGNAGGNPNSGDLRETGFDGTAASLNPLSLPSTYSTTITADGTNNVVLRFTAYADTAVHRQLWGMNAFQLTKQP